MTAPRYARDVPDPIGRSVPRSDGLAKVTGRARYTGDLVVPGMLHAAVVRSPYAHARILAIHATAAQAMDGVRAVVTAADLAGFRLRFGSFVPDQPILASGTTVYQGDPVAAVVAEDPLTAAAARDLVEVGYEPLAAVTDAREALRPDAPVVHPLRYPVAHRPGAGEPVEPEHLNVCFQSRQAWGDVDEAFRGAAFVARGTYEFPLAYAYAMEPYSAIADVSGGRITVWASAQHPFVVRQDLAAVFGVPLSDVRVIVPFVGGGYGSKSFTKIEPLACALSIVAQRPVRLVYSIDESILTTRADGASVEFETAFGPDGTIRGRRGRILLNSGAYAGSSPAVARAAAVRAAGPYRIPAVHVDCLSVYTNTAPASSYRGFGAPQAVWASEQQLDEAGEALGLDGFEIRLRNLVERDAPIFRGSRPLDADLRADLEIVRETLAAREGEERPGRRRAIGVAISASDAGFIPVSTATVRVHADGSVSMLSGSTELGQGSATVLGQIAAAELGVAFECVSVVQGDTGTVPFETSTGASRTTTIVGLAIQRACADARQRLRSMAADNAGVSIDAVSDVPGGVSVSGRVADWGAVIREWFGSARGEVVGTGYVRREGTLAELPPFWEIGCVGAEVSLDEATGEITVERLVTVGDVGRAINPRLTEGQDAGAATQGLGLALYEELIYVDGSLHNAGIVDYRVPRTTDMPPLTTVLAERGDGIGPYGAKGGGEGAMNPVAPAIANAVARLTGVRQHQAPMIPERVWEVLNRARATSEQS